MLFCTVVGCSFALLRKVCWLALKECYEECYVVIYITNCFGMKLKTSNSKFLLIWASRVLVIFE
jgi:hypothetical protein